jgi:hypothetical protein
LDVVFCFFLLEPHLSVHQGPGTPERPHPNFSFVAGRKTRARSGWSVVSDESGIALGHLLRSIVAVQAAIDKAADKQALEGGHLANCQQQQDPELQGPTKTLHAKCTWLDLSRLVLPLLSRARHTHTHTHLLRHRPTAGCSSHLGVADGVQGETRRAEAASRQWAAKRNCDGGFISSTFLKEAGFLSSLLLG